MFGGRRVFGSPEAWHLELEYGAGGGQFERAAAAGSGSSSGSDDGEPGVAAPSTAATKNTATVVARLEFDWTADEDEAKVLERFGARQAELQLAHITERVVARIEREENTELLEIIKLFY